MVEFEIFTYEIYLRDMMISGKRSYALIVCHSEVDEHRFGIYFFDSNSSLPQNTYNSERKWGTSCLPKEQYEWYLDLLRNEQTVYAVLNPDNPKINGLRTSEGEPGEGEYF